MVLFGLLEDLFEIELFCSIVNDAYELSAKHELTPDKLRDAEPATTRKVKQAEAYFRVLPDDFPLYNHFVPASALLAASDRLSGTEEPVMKTLAKAENLIKALNSLLD